MPANLENSVVAAGLEKVTFHSNPKERQCQIRSNYRTVALISHASKVMLKILQARLQQYANRELPDVQAGFRKGRRPEIKLPTSSGSWKKQESARKTSISASLQRRQWHPTPVLLPGKSHGWRSLLGYSPWGRKESDMTERLHFSLYINK